MVVAGAARYAKTAKGIEEIAERRNNLRGKMRMMLILVDPSKGAEQLLWHAASLGLPPDCLDVMASEGYIAPADGIARIAAEPAVVRGRPAPAASSASVVPHDDASGGSIDEADPRLAPAKALMCQTLAAVAVAGRPELAARIEGCRSVVELASALPDYERAIAHVAGDIEADRLGDRVRKLLK